MKLMSLANKPSNRVSLANKQLPNFPKKGDTMSVFEILETYETFWCDIHRNFVSSAECFECEFKSCADCLRAYGCDNCE